MSETLTRVPVADLKIGDIVAIEMALPAKVTSIIKYEDGYTVFVQDCNGYSEMFRVELNATFRFLDWSQADFDAFAAL